jgi:hypothetical protein
MSDRSSELVMTPSLLNDLSRARIVPNVADFLGVMQKIGCGVLARSKNAK